MSAKIWFLIRSRYLDFAVEWAPWTLLGFGLCLHPNFYTAHLTLLGVGFAVWAGPFLEVQAEEGEEDD